MMHRQAFAAGLAVFLLLTSVNAQKAEITISLNEQFFDVLLDGVFRHAAPPEFPLANKEMNRRDAETQSGTIESVKWNTENEGTDSKFSILSASRRLGGLNPVCPETIKLLRESNGLRTAVRFRDGKIYTPLAFSGSYNPPFIGCVEFSGYAETNIELEFDQQSQRLIARAKVLNVSLNGTGGVGGTVIARMLQSSIDKRINPIEIVQMDKISFVVPIQNSGKLRMKAVGTRHEIVNGSLNIYIAYEFVKA